MIKCYNWIYRNIDFCTCFYLFCQNPSLLTILIIRIDTTKKTAWQEMFFSFSNYFLKT